MASPARRPYRATSLLIGAPLFLALARCSTLESVDNDTSIALRRSAEEINEVAGLPKYDPSKYTDGSAFPPLDDSLPPTSNPPATDLYVQERDVNLDSTQDVIDRFNEMVNTPADAQVISFPDALLYAAEHATEYLNSEEFYIIATLNLLIEEHAWGPRFFNNTIAGFTASGGGDGDGRYTTALSVLNDFGVTHKLPYGGEVSAHFLVSATEQLDNAVNQGDNQNADIILAASIPLLRNAGATAQESLVQARRNLVYAAREFQTFRRNFYLDLASDYLQLIFQKQQIGNSEGQVKRSLEVENRTIALVEAGRTEPFQADLARQNTLFAIDRLAQLKENFRLFMDRFKLRIGMSSSVPLDVAPEALRLPPVKATLTEAVRLAMQYRLDVQTEADRTEDFRRQVDVAKNQLQGELNLALAADMSTDGTRIRSGLQFLPGDTKYTAGLVYSMPLDRMTEQAQYRQSQIRLEQQRRRQREFNDEVSIQARQSVRAIEKAQFSLLISERNVQVSENRLAAIEAAPDRATARDRTEAVNNLQRAQDTFEQSKRDLQLAILAYLGSTGQLRVDDEGQIALPEGLSELAAP